MHKKVKGYCEKNLKSTKRLVTHFGVITQGTSQALSSIASKSSK